jgi:hypothetical protein
MPPSGGMSPIAVQFMKERFRCHEAEIARDRNLATSTNRRTIDGGDGGFLTEFYRSNRAEKGTIDHIAHLC